MNQKLIIKLILLISKVNLVIVGSFAIVLEPYLQISLAQAQSEPPPLKQTPDNPSDIAPVTSPDATPNNPSDIAPVTSPDATPVNPSNPQPNNPPINNQNNPSEDTTPVNPSNSQPDNPPINNQNNPSEDITPVNPSNPQPDNPPLNNQNNPLNTTPVNPSNPQPDNPPLNNQNNPLNTTPVNPSNPQPDNPPLNNQNNPSEDTTPVNPSNPQPNNPPINNQNNPLNTTPVNPSNPQPNNPPINNQNNLPNTTTTSETIPSANYIGVGGNFGLSGDTALGENGFTIFSKIGLTNNFSVRPAAVFGDNTVITAPVTIDFPIKSSTDSGKSQTIAVPYVGWGPALSTGKESSLDLVLTGGIDVRLSDEFSANAQVNVGFFDETDTGLTLGIGYNF